MTNGKDLINQEVDTDSEYDTRNNVHFSRTYSYGKGLSKREYFAAMAMQGMLANSIDNQQGMEPFWRMGNERLAQSAVLQADALIKALNENT